MPGQRAAARPALAARVRRPRPRPGRPGCARGSSQALGARALVGRGRRASRCRGVGPGPAGRGCACALLTTREDAVGFEGGVAGWRVWWVPADRAADALYVGTASWRRPCSRGPSAARGGPQDPRRRARSCVRPAPRGLPRWRLVCEETAWPWPAFAAHLFQLQAPRGGSRVLCRPDRSGPGAAGRRAPAAVLRALRLLPRSCLSGPRCDPPAFSGIPSRAAPSRTPSPPSASYGTSPSASRKRCVASFSSSPWDISVTVFADLPVVKERSRVLAVLSASLSVFF